MIHAFHGFLGRPSDLSFLGKNVLMHDLHSLDTKALAADLGEQDVLIGYSMGGRRAMELASLSGFKIKRLVLINAHPGLASDEERSARRKWEDEVLERLASGAEGFLSWWNALPLFAQDLPVGPEMDPRSAALFDRHRLSEQKNFLPELLAHKEKVLMLAGSEDEKYRLLAETMLMPKGLDCRIISGGHRLFQRPQEVLKVLKEEKII